MRSSTLFVPLDLCERDVARLLEERYGAAWFPDHHRCSIDTGDGFVAVDVDRGYVSSLHPDEQLAVASRLGFPPRTALHVHASIHYSGSDGLAEEVIVTLARHYSGRTLAA